jgi:hypothetical protein
LHFISIKTCETRWTVFAEADKNGNRDDVKDIKETLIREADLVLPDLEQTKTSMRMMLGVIKLLLKIFGKRRDYERENKKNDGGGNNLI